MIVGLQIYEKKNTLIDTDKILFKISMKLFEFASTIASFFNLIWPYCLRKISITLIAMSCYV